MSERQQLVLVQQIQATTIVVAIKQTIIHNKHMQREDIIRIREAQEADHIKLEHQQNQLIHELKQTIKKKTIVATEKFNDVLQQAINIIKNS